MENPVLIVGIIIVAMVAIGWGVIEMVGRGLDSDRARSTKAPRSQKRMAAKRRPKSSRSRRR